MFWKHLVLAEMISGQYTGASGGSNGWASIGYNIPEGAISGSGFAARNGGWNNRDATYGRYGNGIIFGSVNGNYLSAGALTSKEAKALDKKMDDGIPHRGDLRPTRSVLRDAGGNLVYDVYDMYGGWQWWLYCPSEL